MDRTCSSMFQGELIGLGSEEFGGLIDNLCSPTRSLGSSGAVSWWGESGFCTGVCVCVKSVVCRYGLSVFDLKYFI